MENIMENAFENAAMETVEVAKKSNSMAAWIAAGAVVVVAATAGVAYKVIKSKKAKGESELTEDDFVSDDDIQDESDENSEQ